MEVFVKLVQSKSFVEKRKSPLKKALKRLCNDKGNPFLNLLWHLWSSYPLSIVQIWQYSLNPRIPTTLFLYLYLFSHDSQMLFLRIVGRNQIFLISSTTNIVPDLWTVSMILFIFWFIFRFLFSGLPQDACKDRIVRAVKTDT